MDTRNTNLYFFLECLPYAPEQVTLRDGKRSNVDTIACFLRLLAKNTSLKQLGLSDLMYSAASLAEFFRSFSSTSTSTATKLCIMGCSIAEQQMQSTHQKREDDNWKEDLKVAILGNPSLQCLQLRYTDVIFLGPLFLEALGQHHTTMIDTLELCGSPRHHVREAVSMETTTKVIRLLLERKQITMPLRIRFLLGSFDDDTFAPIVQGAVRC
jgi:hypothetical protein